MARRRCLSYEYGVILMLLSIIIPAMPQHSLIQGWQKALADKQQEVRILSHHPEARERALGLLN